MIFTDLHVEIIDNPLERVESLIGSAMLNMPEFIINLGDFGYFGKTGKTNCPLEKQPINYRIFNDESTDKYMVMTLDLLKKFQSINIPIYSVIGNHDVDFASKSDVINYYKMPANHYYIDYDNLRLIFLDTNFYLDGDKEVGYERGNNFDADSASYLPKEQIIWLKELISTDRQVLLFSHHPLNSGPRGIKNSDELINLLSLFPDKQFISFNGHTHVDEATKVANITFINVNSASYYWQGVDGPYKNEWTEETLSIHPILEYIVRYPETLHQIIEIRDTSIKIKGKTSCLTYGMKALEEFGITPSIKDKVL